ncbi:MAG: hypothetical protein AAFV98_00345 [Chloroflexota bacterium]
MANHSIQEGKDASEFEVHVSATFADELAYQDVSKVLEIMARLTQNIDIRGVLLIGVKQITVTQTDIDVVFVFSTDTTGLEDLALQDRDFESKMQANYVFHIFAVLDSTFTLAEHPFPPDFRRFIVFK